MFTWRKILSFAIVSLLVLLALFWLFDTLRSSFEKIVKDNHKQLVNVLSEAAPREREPAESWVESVAKSSVMQRLFM